MYGSMEESTPAAEAPALGPAELKAVRELLSATSKTTTGDDARPAGLLHEPQELSTSTLTKLEAASDEVELQAPVLAATRVACRRMGPRRRWPVDNLYCITFRVLSGVKHGRTPRARRNFLPHERAREGPAPTPSTRTHNLNLSERRQVLGHDRLEGAAPRSPAQRHAPQRTM